jgi:hypothetical protein
MPGGVVYQRILVALEIAQQITDVPLETPDAGHVANMLALRPPTQGRELAPASGPAPVPQAPLRTLQSANRLVGQALVGRACAEARAVCSACSKHTAACVELGSNSATGSPFVIAPGGLLLHLVFLCRSKPSVKDRIIRMYGKFARAVTA